MPCTWMNVSSRRDRARRRFRSRSQTAVFCAMYGPSGGGFNTAGSTPGTFRADRRYRRWSSGAADTPGRKRFRAREYFLKAQGHTAIDVEHHQGCLPSERRAGRVNPSRYRLWRTSLPGTYRQVPASVTSLATPKREGVRFRKGPPSLEAGLARRGANGISVERCQPERMCVTCTNRRRGKCGDPDINLPDAFPARHRGKAACPDPRIAGHRRDNLEPRILPVPAPRQ